MGAPEQELPHPDRLEYETAWDEHLLTISAFDGRDRVGIASGTVAEGDDLPYLEDVTVVESAGRGGVGSRLVRLVGDAFKERGYGVMDGDAISEGGLRTVARAYGPERLEFPDEPGLAYEDAVARLASGDSAGVWFRVRL